MCFDFLRDSFSESDVYMEGKKRQDFLFFFRLFALVF